MEFTKERIYSSLLTKDNYVSTENMFQNFQGVTTAQNIPVETYVLEYKQGDVLVSNIRPYLKKVWMADKNGGCSADVFVMRAKKNLCSDDFLHHIIANDRFINYVMSAAKGVKMPRGDKEHMRGYDIFLPSLNEQQNIAHLLSILDKRIATQIRIIEDLKQLLSAIRSELLHQDWTKFQIKDVCTPIAYKSFIKQVCDIKGEYPIIQQGDNPIVGYSSGKPYCDFSHVILFGDHTLSIYRPTTPFFLATDGFKVLCVKDFIERDFLYYIIDEFKPQSEGYKRHYSILKETFVPIPAIDKQKDIATKLLVINKKIEVEKAIISCMQQQKAFLLRHMFI